MSDSTDNKQDILYYDGHCPLCSVEICKLSKNTGDKLRWQNIHELDEREEMADLPSRDVLLEGLHVKTADGQWLVGIDANIRAWHHTPYHGIWRFLDWPIIRIFSHATYELWLKLRKRG